MSDADIKALEESLTALGKRWDDIDALSARLTTAKQLEAFDQMDLINIRIGWLETKRNHLKAAIVTVSPPSAEDIAQIQDALAALSTAIAKGTQWSAAKKILAKALAAARTINTNIEGRQQPAG